MAVAHTWTAMKSLPLLTLLPCIPRLHSHMDPLCAKPLSQMLMNRQPPALVVHAPSRMTAWQMAWGTLQGSAGESVSQAHPTGTCLLGDRRLVQGLRLRVWTPGLSAVRECPCLRGPSQGLFGMACPFSTCPPLRGELFHG